MYNTTFFRVLSILLAIVCWNPKAMAFGQTGHRIVGEIAESELNSRARKQIKKIAGVDSLAELSTWSDFIRSDPSWRHADQWHYMSIADDESFINYKSPTNGDILTALTHFESVLRDPKATQQARREALAFYVHLMGDLHQPLHVGRAQDRGGNDVGVLWFGERSNLHRVWDTDLIDHRQLSYSEYVKFLEFDENTPLPQWRCGNYQTWAEESFALRKQVYDFGKQREETGAPYLSYQYVFANRATLDLRLQQAGVRLAAMLNAIFANKSLPVSCAQK